MMYKVWSPYSFHTDFNPYGIVQVHSRGLDKAWAKTASLDDSLAAKLDDYTVPKGHTLIFVAPVAESERYGPNSKGDAFSKQACQDYHHTFLDGHLFTEHEHDDPSIAFGKPVASEFNTKVGRVEVLALIENDKNPRLVEKIASGEPVDTSMACRVSYDSCSICGNNASHPIGPGPQNDSPGELARVKRGYCKHARDQLNQILDDGRKVYVDNPEPKFFDLSHVQMPAEVMARVMHTRKAASTSIPGLSGVKLAGMVGLADPALVVRFSPPDARDHKLRLARKLAEMEKQVPSTVVMIAGGGSEIGDRAKQLLKKMRKKCGSSSNFLAACRHEGIVLPFDDFCQLVEEAEPKCGAAGLFNQLKSAGLLESAAEDGAYDRPELAWGVPGEAHELAPGLSFGTEHVQNRMTEHTKLGFLGGDGACGQRVQTDPLLRKYGSYLLAELAGSGDLQIALTAAGLVAN